MASFDKEEKVKGTHSGSRALHVLGERSAPHFRHLPRQCYTTRTQNSTSRSCLCVGHLSGTARNQRLRGSRRGVTYLHDFLRTSLEMINQVANLVRFAGVHDQREQDVDRGNRETTPPGMRLKSTTQERPPTGLGQSPPRQPQISDRTRSRTVLKGTAYGPVSAVPWDGAHRSLGRRPFVPWGFSCVHFPFRARCRVASSMLLELQCKENIRSIQHAAGSSKYLTFSSCMLQT